MSVGSSIIPRESASPNSKNYGASRPRNLYGPKTTYKVSKPKNPKATGFTRQEIFGLCCSAILSVVLSCLLVYVVHIGSPIILRHLISAANRYLGHDETTTQNNHRNNKNFNMLSLQANLSEFDFNSKYFNKYPVLFSMPERHTRIHSKIISLLSTKYSDQPISIFSTSSLNDLTRKENTNFNFSMEEYLRFDFSLNPQLQGNEELFDRADDSHMFLSDSVVITRMPLVMDLLDSSVRRNNTSSVMDEHYLFNKLFNNKQTRVLAISKGRSRPSLSGSSFHSHKHTVNELLQGAKHWYIYPPHKFPPPTGFNPAVNVGRWTQTVLPTLSADARPIEIIQHAGEAVYIPEGWYHATHSIGAQNETEVDSVSVSHFIQEAGGSQASSSGRITGSGYRHYLLEGHRRFSLPTPDFMGAIKMYTLGLALCRDVTLLQHLGELHRAHGNYSTAEGVFREVLDRNPRDPKGYAQLVNLLLAYGRDESKTIGELLERAEAYDLRDEVLQMT